MRLTCYIGLLRADDDGRLHTCQNFAPNRPEARDVVTRLWKRDGWTMIAIREATPAELPQLMAGAHILY